jgi:hypothetical protein
MGGYLDRLRRLSDRRAREGRGRNGGRVNGIFHNWSDGPNVIRLVGDKFLEVKTHFVAPGNRGDRGLCQVDAFKGDDHLPKVVNCLNWDIQKEEPAETQKCPICELHAIAKMALQEEPTPEEKKFFEELLSATRPRDSLKWNILDRDDPHVVQVAEDGTETKILGFKIATIGMEAWTDIEGIYEQCGFDIGDVDEGIDICVTKGKNAMRVVYSAQAVLMGKGLKVTPLTDEERALPQHDLKQRCGKMTKREAIVDALHPDLRELLELNENDAGAQDDTPPPAKHAPVPPSARQAPARQAPAQKPASQAPAATQAPAKRQAPAAAPAAPDSNDMFAGGSQKTAGKAVAKPAAKPAAAPSKVKEEPEPEPDDENAGEAEGQDSAPAGDFADIDPETWECFGTAKETDAECKGCPFLKKCIAKRDAK